jgi:hypothetical protein
LAGIKDNDALQLIIRDRRSQKLDAVEDLLDAFLERNKITAEQMTPAQAREFVQEVIGSSDPRIRDKDQAGSL